MNRFLVALLLTCAAGLNATEPPWVEIRSPHFTVITNGSDRQARDLAGNFEQIHETFAKALPGLRTDSGAETIVIGAKDEKTMKMLLPSFWQQKGAMHPAGLFNKGWERDYAVVRLDEEGPGFSTIYHEYVHKLLGLNFTRLPVWLNEGLADFFSNVQFRSNQTILGAPSGRLVWFQRQPIYPLDQFLAAGPSSPLYRQEDKVGMFYAECWGLAHFLMFGKGMGNGQKFNEYLRALQSGVDSRKAMEQVYGPVSQIQSQFEAYVHQLAFSGFVLSTAIQFDKSSLDVHRMTAAETDAFLGGFYEKSRQMDAAGEKLKQAVAEDDKLAIAHENLGLLDFVEGQDQAADQEFATARKLDPRDYLAIYYGSMLDAATGNPEGLAKLNDAMGEVLAINPKLAEAWVVRSHLYIRQHNLKGALEAAVQAGKLEPDRAGYYTNVAQISLLLHDYANAVRLSKYVTQHWSGPDAMEALTVLQQARKLGGIPATAQDEAEEAEVAKYAAGTTAVEGVIASVTCDEHLALKDVALNSGGKTLEFQPAKSFGMGWSDTLWFGSDHFNVCHHLTGLKAVVRYQASSGKPDQPELRWLEIRDSIVP